MGSSLTLENWKSYWNELKKLKIKCIIGKLLKKHVEMIQFFDFTMIKLIINYLLKTAVFTVLLIRQKITIQPLPTHYKHLVTIHILTDTQYIHKYNVFKLVVKFTMPCINFFISSIVSFTNKFFFIHICSKLWNDLCLYVH